MYGIVLAVQRVFAFITQQNPEVALNDSPTLPRPIDTRRSFLDDVLETAISHSVGYWALIERTANTVDHRPVFAIVSLRSTPDLPNPPRDKFVLNRALIEIGIRRSRSASQLTTNLRKTILNASEQNDSANIDAECADVIVQLAIFGEIINS